MYIQIEFHLQLENYLQMSLLGTVIVQHRHRKLPKSRALFPSSTSTSDLLCFLTIHRRPSMNTNAQNTSTSSGTKSSPMDYAMSMVSHNDYTVSLTISDDHIMDIPTKNCTQLSKQLFKRSQAASRRSKRLPESLRSLQSWESGKALDSGDSSDFDFDDGLRDSIHLTKERLKSAHMMCDDLRDSIYLTKERMKSVHMMCDDEGDAKKSIHLVKQQTNPAPVLVKQGNAKGMIPMHNWKNTTYSPSSQPLASISKAA